ncbi:MAG: hypothetical protein V2J62_07610 [candidate division KSB1 bacterium]|jgi:hypothetical protein|nr:hypothetical protein [candidate division KSB1 bacterium]
MSFWDDVSEKFKKSVSVLANKTDEYTKIGKIKVDIISIKRDLDKVYNKLGEKVYDLIVDEKNTRIASNEDVKELIGRGKLLKEKVRLKKEALQAVHDEYEDMADTPSVEGEAEEKKTEEKAS